MVGSRKIARNGSAFFSFFHLFTYESPVVDVGLVIVVRVFAVVVEGVVADEEALIEYRSSSATLRVHRMTRCAVIHYNIVNIIQFLNASEFNP